MADDILLDEVTQIGPFSWAWPEGIEHFDRGWIAQVSADGQRLRVRHGLGGREVFGRFRVHTVTWVEGRPTVEGVAADDYESSRSLCSLIKLGKSHLPLGSPIPAGYEKFTVVVQSEVVAARHSPRSLAVKVREDDVAEWARHAVLRARAWDRLPRTGREPIIEITPAGPAASEAPLMDGAPASIPAVVAAARQVVERYGGDAGRIWADKPRAAEIQRRFDAFLGIGQKKAAMAVEILERDLRVPVTEMAGSDVAYDVHVRRVFLRTGLAERDDQEHMIQRARNAYPKRPGALDLPAWEIGRMWCRPSLPNCAPCPLTLVCRKDIERAARVRGS